MKKVIGLILAISVICASFGMSALAGDLPFAFHLTCNIDGFDYLVSGDPPANGQTADDAVRLEMRSYYGSTLALQSDFPNGFPKGIYVHQLVSAAPEVARYFKNENMNDFINVVVCRVHPYTADRDIKVVCANGAAETETISFPDQKPVLLNGSTLLPIRAIAEYFGWEVSWDETEKSAIISDGTKTIVFYIGETSATVRTEDDLDFIDLPVAASLLGGRTLLPVRAVAEALDSDVAWDDATSTITIRK